MEDTTGTTSTVNTPTSTLGDARASLVAAESSPATPEASSVSTPASAATSPAETPVVATSTDSTVDPRSPIIPRERFDEVNTRMQRAEDSLKQYEGFRDFQPEELAGLVHIGRSMKTDPVGYVGSILDQILAHPQYAAAMQARLAPHAGRLLAANRGRVADDPAPEPDLQAGDGTLVYSAPQLQKWQEWNARQLTAQLTKQFEEKLQPLQRTAQTMEQREAAAQAHREASQAIAKFATNPDFVKHKPDVSAEIAKDARLQALADRDPEAALEIAWGRVERAKVLPLRDQKTEEKVLANLQQRAVAGTTNPGAASTSAPPNMIGNARAALEYASSVVGAA